MHLYSLLSSFDDMFVLNYLVSFYNEYLLYFVPTYPQCFSTDRSPGQMDTRTGVHKAGDDGGQVLVQVLGVHGEDHVRHQQQTISKKVNISQALLIKLI